MYLSMLRIAYANALDSDPEEISLKLWQTFYPIYNCNKINWGHVNVPRTNQFILPQLQMKIAFILCSDKYLAYWNNYFISIVVGYMVPTLVTKYLKNCNFVIVSLKLNWISYLQISAYSRNFPRAVNTQTHVDVDSVVTF